MGTREFREQLSKQLNFLRRSSRLFDQGEHDEAIRIATILRVLLRDGKNYKAKSQALLRRFEISRSVQLISTVSEKQAKSHLGGLSIARFEMPPAGSNEHPRVAVVPTFAVAALQAVSVSRHEWVAEAVYRTDVNLTRAEIFGAAADQDGGAHVDAELDEKYLIIRNRVDKFEVIDEAGEPQEPQWFGNAHFADLRQMAFEILNSPDILALERGEWLS